MKDETTEKKPTHRHRGRIRTMIMIRPDILAAMKARAKKETEAKGGAIRRGGSGIVTVSDLLERVLLDRLKPVAIGQNDQVTA